MVVGDGTLLVQLLMATFGRIISNSGSMAMVAAIPNDDNSEVLAEDKQYMRPIANRVPPCARSAPARAREIKGQRSHD